MQISVYIAALSITLLFLQKYKGIMIEVYGIKNCNTVKKALDYLKDNDISYNFHDYKKEPASIAKLEAWERLTPWETLVNKKGTTWKKLSPEEQASVQDAETANAVLLKNNSMIKRPVLEFADTIVVGFDEEIYNQKLKIKL